MDWYLHELDVPFDAKSPGDPNNPHPFGQIPALRDGEVEAWESGAILMYLADRYGGLDTPAKRADANKWVVWANASLDPVLFIENERGQVLDSGARRAESPKALTRLESVLSQREFLSGDAFGVADVAVASYLLFVPIFFADVSFARWPNTARYMGRCVVRPAYSKAFGGRTAAYLAPRSDRGGVYIVGGLTMTTLGWLCDESSCHQSTLLASSHAGSLLINQTVTSSNHPTHQIR